MTFTISASAASPTLWLALCLALLACANGVAVDATDGIDTEKVDAQQQQQGSSSNGFVQDQNDKMLDDLATWVQDAEDAVISDKIQMRDHPTKPIRAVFATQDIGEGEVLLYIPWSVMISPPDRVTKNNIYTTNFKEEDMDWYFELCFPVRAVYDELMSDDPTPYGTYLKQQPRGYLPGLWSMDGKEYFEEIIPESLPPGSDIFNHVHNSFWRHCKDILGLPALDESLDGDDDNEDDGDVETRSDNYDPTGNRKAEGIDMDMMLHAWMMITARGEDAFMIPIYDMFNHQNGELLNTEHDLVKKVYFKLSASKDIAADDELYNTYNQCGPCAFRRYGFGTADMFLSYGFVENYPQRYMADFHDVRLKFDIDRATLDGDSTEASRWNVTFLAPLSPDAVKYMKDSVRALEESSVAYADEEKPDDIPLHEYDMTWQLHDAYLTAFKAALDASSETTVSDEVWKMSRDWYRPGWEYIFEGEKEDEDDDDEDDNDEDDDDEEEDDEDETHEEL